MKILVIGGSGFIGSRIRSSLTLTHEVIGTFFSNPPQNNASDQFEQLDIRDKISVKNLITRVRPDLVVQVYGTKSIEYCASNPDEARRIHVEGTRHVAEACQRFATRLAYISTDCVFDGSKSFFSEEDATCPFNVYGHAKWEGEQLLQHSGLDVVIIRASLLFGWREIGQASNFVLSILDALRANSAKSAATNLHNTPLEITRAAEVIAHIALSQEKGIFNVAGYDRISRYDFAVAVAETFNLDLSLLQPVIDTSGLRQQNSCLTTNKTETTLKVKFEGVKEGLFRMTQQLPMTL